jgi:hypothetical protein
VDFIVINSLHISSCVDVLVIRNPRLQIAPRHYSYDPEVEHNSWCVSCQGHIILRMVTPWARVNANAGHTEAERMLPDRTGCVNTLSVHVGNYTSVRMDIQQERGP